LTADFRCRFLVMMLRFFAHSKSRLSINLNCEILPGNCRAPGPI
jgi:hypothetical protein